MKNIPFYKLQTNIFELFDKNWFLLTSGSFEKKDFNTMTVSWGFLGIMWNKPCAIAAVRPNRFTYEFMEKYNSFSLCSFDKKFKSDLNLLGSKSGRDGDKISETDLSPCASQIIEAPSFSESNLILECKKIYFNDLLNQNFLDPKLELNYPKKDYHRIYIGEIVNILGSDFDY